MSDKSIFEKKIQILDSNLNNLQTIASLIFQQNPAALQQYSSQIHKIKKQLSQIKNNIPRLKPQILVISIQKLHEFSQIIQAKLIEKIKKYKSGRKKNSRQLERALKINKKNPDKLFSANANQKVFAAATHNHQQHKIFKTTLKSFIEP